MSEYEHTLEVALSKLNQGFLNQSEIHLIRSACGKPLGELVAERNHLTLDAIFADYDKIFGGKA